MKTFHILIFILLSVRVHAQFTPFQVVSEKITDPFAVLTDVDNDGDLDVVNIARGVSKLTVYRNDGNGEMIPSQVIADSFFMRTHMVIGDVDNDGWEDLITIIYSNGYKVALYRNNMGEYAPPEMLFTFQFGISFNENARICLTNKNADQYPEIALSHEFGKISIFNNIAGVFQPATTIAVNLDMCGGFAETLQSIDMDNDGDEDLFSSRDDNASFKKWYKNTGGVYSPVQYLNNASNSAIKTIMTDLTNDSLPDFINIFNNGIAGTGIYWWDNLFPPYTPGVSFSPSAGTILSNALNYDIAYESDFTAVDINNDGFTDFITNTDDEIYGFINDGNNNFTMDTFYIDSGPYTLAYAWEEFHMSFGDINNDGNMDILVVNKSEDDLFWLEHDGQLNFEQHLIRYNASTPLQVHAIDINNDGSKDIISLYGRKKGIHKFESINALEYEQNVRIEGTENLTYYNLEHKEFDMDDDGDLDLINLVEAGNYPFSAVNWFENNPTNPFGVYHEDPVGFNFRVLRTGDINNDGLEDLIFVNTNYELLIKFNLGGGTFGPVQLISTGNISNFEIKDMNGDQLLDFVVRVPNAPSGPSSSQNGLAIIENLGGQSFLPMTVPLVAVGTGSTSKISLGDLNNDGLIDIVCSEYYSSLKWYPNLGSNSFGPIQTVSTLAWSAIDHFVNDLDSDGDNDVIVVFENVNTDENSVRWYENDGLGNFLQHIIASGIEDVNDADFNDLDGDGDIDILIAADEDIVGFYRNDFIYPNQIYGAIFIDLDTNGIHDPNEPGLDFASSVLTPNAITSFANIESEYFFAVDTGNYIVSYSNVDTVIWQRTTDSLVYHVSIDSANTYSGPYNFGFFPQIDSTSLFVDLASNGMGCDLNLLQHLTVRNIGGTFPKAKIVYEYDPLVTIDSITPIPDSVVNNSIYWSFDSLFFFDEFTPIIELTTPDFNSIGDTLDFKLSVTTIDSLGNDEYLFEDGFSAILTCAYDPNNKLAETKGYLEQGFILPTEEFIDYTINFQNTGTDTAFNIKITDALSNNLNWSTLRILSSSHLVNVTCNAAGLIDFNFPTINLPDSGASYINSMGYVKFRIELDENLAPSSTIKNKASIYFDQNPPIITNETLHTIFDCSWLSGASSDSSTLCIQNTSQLFYLGNFYESVEWSIDGVLLGDSPILLYQFGSDSTYEIVLGSQNPMCLYDTTFFVTIGAAPSFSIDTLSALSICNGDSVEVMASSQINWFSSLSQIEIVDSIFTVSETDQIYLSKGIGNCFTYDTLNITSIPLPVAAISAADTTICVGDSLFLMSNISSGNSWFNNGQIIGTSDSLITNQAGVILLQVEDANGCVSELDSFTLTIDYPETLNILSQSGTVICETDSTLLTVGIAGNIQWFFEGLFVSFNDSLFASDMGWFAVELSDTACPNQIDSVLIDIEIAPSVSITSLDSSFCSGDSILLTATSNSNYDWILNSTIIGNSQDVFVNIQGDYFVEAFGNSCSSAIDSVTITELTNPTLTINYTYHQLEITAQNVVSFEWYLNGNLLIGENSSSSINPADGHYLVNVIFDNGCSASAEYELSVNDLSETNSNAPFIYPNPVINYLTIEWGTNTDFTQVNVRDIKGRIVSEFHRENEGSTSVLLDYLASGVYIVEFTGKSEQILNYRLMKQ